MSQPSYFITGTDTGAGKTWATLALMQYFKQQGHSVAGMKPVATGCKWDKQQLQNQDALLIQDHASISLDYNDVNPYAFEMPVAPHLAAKEKAIKLDVIVNGFRQLREKTDSIIVEGAGGWCVPLNEKEDWSDLVKMLEIPVIVVVAMTLGCINHARLTVEQIASDGIHCAGWLAVCLDSEMLLMDENIDSIKNRVSVPLLGILPYIEKADFNLLASKIVL